MVLLQNKTNADALPAVKFSLTRTLFCNKMLNVAVVNGEAPPFTAAVIGK
jgi:hypothetical protein